MFLASRIRPELHSIHFTIPQNVLEFLKTTTSAKSTNEESCAKVNRLWAEQCYHINVKISIYKVLIIQIRSYGAEP